MPPPEWPADSMSREEKIEWLFSRDFCDDVHIQAFARALSAPDEESTPPSPIEMRSSSRQLQNLGVPRHLQHERVRKVSAASDFAPIHTKIQRRRRDTPRPNQEKMYQILRWPLLLILGAVIGIEFGIYVLIRQIVNAFEWLLAWRGPKRVLRSHLRNATTWEGWKRAANVMDEFLGFNDWKREDGDPYYDYSLVRKVRRSLKVYRQAKDVSGLLGVLEVCIRNNFAGTENPRLYSETFIGTKDSIEAYLKEVEEALAFIRTTPELGDEEKRRLYRSANRSFGSSALCFSGGAAFGFYHFGVLRAFLEADLMPRVFNGTSAGGLTAAFACTYTDEELRLMLGPRLADHITCFEEPFSTTLPRLFQTGAMFDTLAWARKSTFFTRGSMTFREAYNRTGKVLNVSVIPSDRYSPTKLLNYLTAPDCVIWSAIIASSAVPTILNPVVLMQKNKFGQVLPWNWGSRFKDGSLRVDVPTQSLNLLFNVNNIIVSQVNPHVHLFFFASRGSPGRPVAHRKGKGWRGGFLLSAAEQFLKLELTKNFKVIRDLELMPQILGQDWSSVLLQRFDGSVTIRPRTIGKDFLRILSDPTRGEMTRMQQAGELATWPKLHMVENRFRIEREIFRGQLAVRKQNARRTGIDLPRPDENPTSGRLGVDQDVSMERQNNSQSIAPFANATIAIDSDAENGYEERLPIHFGRSIGQPNSQSSQRRGGDVADDEHYQPAASTSHASVPVQRNLRASQSFPRSIARSHDLALGKGSTHAIVPTTSESSKFFLPLNHIPFPRFSTYDLSHELLSLSASDDNGDDDHEKDEFCEPKFPARDDGYESSSDSIEATWEMPPFSLSPNAIDFVAAQSNANCDKPVQDA